MQLALARRNEKCTRGSACCFCAVWVPRAPGAPTLVEGNRTLDQSARVVPGVRPRVLHARAIPFFFVESPQVAHASVGRFDTEPRA